MRDSSGGNGTLFEGRGEIHALIKSLPTIFPLLIKKIGFIVLIVITKSVSRFANLLKLLMRNYLFVISGLAVQIRPWAPDFNKLATLNDRFNP